jgi:protocatechuate 3,4-dioxygenase beta subunit
MCHASRATKEGSLVVRLLFIAVFTLVVDASASRAQPQEATVKLEAIPIDTTPTSVAGVVVDEAGEPIVGVRVEARTPVTGFHSSFSVPEGGESFKPPRVAVTDAQGRFHIADIPLFGVNEVQLSLRAKHRHVNDANYPVAQDLKIEMRGSGRPGVIQARVVGVATDLPVVPFSHLRVVRRYSATAHEFNTEDGRFVLPGEASLGNEYLIYIYARGYAATEARVKAVEAGSDHYQEIALPARAPLRGKLIDAQTGEPIAGAAVLNGIADDSRYFEWRDFEKYADGHHWLKFVQHVTTNEAGEFWFTEASDRAPGTLFVLKGGYQRFVLRPDVRPVDPRTGELVVPVPRESVFTGVVMQDGKPISNADISVQPRERRDKMEQWYGRVHTDSDGRYRFGGLPAGEYTVFAGPYARRAAIHEAQTVEMNLGDDLGEIRIWGQAPGGASIHICAEFDWDYTSLEIEAGEDGTYECRGLKPGSYTARVHVPGGSGEYLGYHYFVPEFIVERDGQQVDLLSERERKKNEQAAVRAPAN